MIRNKQNKGRSRPTEVKLTYNFIAFHNMMLKAMLLMVFVFKSVSPIAQVVEPSRIEIAARIDVPSYQKVLLGENGFLLFFESTDLSEEGKKKWYFTLYDTNFQEQWVQNVAVTNGWVCAATTTSSNQAMFLFTNMEGRKSEKAGYELLKFNLRESRFQLLGGGLPEKAKIVGFASIDNRVLLGVNLDKFQSDLLLYDMDRFTVNSLPHGIQNQTIIQNITADTVSKQFLVSFKSFESKRFKEEVFQIYDIQGRQMISVPLATSPYFLHSYLLSAEQKGTLVAIGSYDNSEGRSNKITETTDQDALTFTSKGLFFIRITANGVQVQRYHPFEGFTNIYKALSKDDLMRTRQRQARSREKPSRDDIVFQFYKPRLQSIGKNYLFAAEAFKPQYRIETRMDYDFYGRLSPFTYSIFEGYNFFSGLIAGFDKQGNLLFSNDVELRDVMLQRLQSVVDVFSDSTDIVAAFVKKGVITSKVMNHNGKEIGQIEQTKVENTFSNDRVTEENYSEISWWYGNNFLVSGYQRITNNRLRSQNPRNVFYLQKMLLE